MKKINRRAFIRSLGTTGIGSFISLCGLPETEASNLKIVPSRPLGKTGTNVSMLGLGGSQNLASKQVLLRQALKMGVTYWDTAPTYGDSEKYMGDYFRKYPNDRKKVFLVTKSNSSNPAELRDSLSTSLDRLKTDHVDMFFIHGVTNAVNELSNDVKQWAETEKKKGRIHFIGFSTHKNMAKCLYTASKLGWIDGIMTSYNYRLMHDDPMKKAVDACAKKGIGLVAMKTQAPFLAKIFADIGNEDDLSQSLTEKFLKKGFTVEQAKLKAVWEDQHIASICSEIKNIAILKDNVDACTTKAKLSRHEKSLLTDYANYTQSFYCKGCAEHCESMLGDSLPVSDIIRCVMYAHEYGETERARFILKEIAPDIIKKTNAPLIYEAEKACPYNMPISAIMNEAERLLA